MIEQDVVVNTKYGRQPAFAACPEAPGQYPPIILYMDAPGFRDELRHMGKRIANHGYFCLVPDLYYRLGTLRFDIPRRNDAMSAVIRGAMLSLNNAAVADDIGGHDRVPRRPGQGEAGPARLRRALHERSVRADGRRALFRACRRRRRCTVSIWSPTSRTRRICSLERIKGELYLGFAGHRPGRSGDMSSRRWRRHCERRAPGTGWRRSKARITASASPDGPTTIRSPPRRAGTRVFDLWDRNLK